MAVVFDSEALARQSRALGKTRGLPSTSGAFYSSGERRMGEYILTEALGSDEFCIALLRHSSWTRYSTLAWKDRDTKLITLQTLHRVKRLKPGAEQGASEPVYKDVFMNHLLVFNEKTTMVAPYLHGSQLRCRSPSFMNHICKAVERDGTTLVPLPFVRANLPLEQYIKCLDVERLIRPIHLNK